MDSRGYHYNLDKVKGCIVGGAAGDALGYPVEFHSSIEQIRQEYGPAGITRFKLHPDGTAHFSDDTQMTLFTASGLLQAGTELNLRHFGNDRSWQYYVANSYIDWYWTQQEGKQYKKHTSWLFELAGLHSRRGPGLTCLGSLHDITKGIDPNNDSKGCGGIMRVAPIALCTDLRELTTPAFRYMFAGKSADITHNAPLGFIPAAFQVMLLDKITATAGDLNLEHLVLECMQDIPAVQLDYDSAKGTYAQFPEAIKELDRLVNMALELSKVEGDDVSNIEKIGGGWTGETALAIALYCALKYTDSFEKAIIAAVNHSGDSDSTGAICGNIMGLVHGYDAIPSFFKEKLELLPMLEEVAEDLFVGSTHTTDEKSWKKKYIQGHRS